MQSVKTKKHKAAPKPFTADQIKADFKAFGVTITEFCTEHKLSRMAVVDLLRGTGKGVRGDSHKAAVLLGLKPDPKTKQITHPFYQESEAA